MKQEFSGFVLMYVTDVASVITISNTKEKKDIYHVHYSLVAQLELNLDLSSLGLLFQIQLLCKAGKCIIFPLIILNCTSLPSLAPITLDKQIKIYRKHIR